MKEQERGFISTTLTVFCRCGDWKYLDAIHKRQAGKEARQIGYRFTKAYGWLCPICQKELGYTATPKEVPHD